MSVAKAILDAIAASRLASADMLEYYYKEGVISHTDLAVYTDYLIEANSALEYKLASIFGVCESRLQVKKGK